MPAFDETRDRDGEQGLAPPLPSPARRAGQPGHSLGYTRLVLETGNLQPAAISVYERVGFARINNFEYYEDIESSCAKP